MWKAYREDQIALNKTKTSALNLIEEERGKTMVQIVRKGAVATSKVVPKVVAKVVAKPATAMNKYQKAAVEITELVGLNPKIDIKQPLDQLKQDLIDAAATCLTPEDMPNISEETVATLTEVGATLPAVQAAAKPKMVRRAPAAKAAAVEVEEVAEEAVEVEEAVEIEEAGGDELDGLDIDQLKQWMKDNDVRLPKLEGYSPGTIFKGWNADKVREALRAMAEPAEVVEAPAKPKMTRAPAAKAKEPEEPKMTRMDAFVAALQEGGGSVATIKQRVTDIYGGDLKENYRVGEWLSLLTVFGCVVKNEEGNYTLPAE